MAMKDKRKFINYKVDAYFRERFSGQRNRRSRECFTGETCMRTLKFLRFFIGCSASLCNATAPWVLSFVEALSVLLLHLLGVRPSALLHQLDPVDTLQRFKFRLSVDDIVTLVLIRAIVLSLAYFVAAMRLYHRLYLYITYFMSAFVGMYATVKLILLDYPRLPHRIPSIIICTIAALASAVHVYAARKTVEWVKRRYQTGLMGISSGNFDELEEPWSSLGYGLVEDPHKASSDGGGDLGLDVAAETMAEPDSRFVEVAGLRVHYKEVVATPGAEEGRVGILLIHGFGAGIFAWRHVMEPLAMQCQCRVVAFDRPGFGLTSRVKPTSEHNPYHMEAQASMVLAFCERIGLEQLVLVAHADSCVLATLVASKACMANSTIQLYPQDSGSAWRSLMPPIAPASDPPPAGPHHTRNPSNGGAHHTRTPSGHTELSVLVDNGLGSSSSSRSSTQDFLPHPPHPPTALGVNGGTRSKRPSSSDNLGDAVPVALEAPAQELSMQTGLHNGRGLDAKQSELQGKLSCPQVLGLAFLHPVMTGSAAPTFARLLARSKLGRSILRPLLRTEIGEVANRRAWYNTDKLTTEVLELYKAPLRVEGWDMALIEITRLKVDLKPHVLSQHFAAFMSRAVLVLTGEQDKVVPPSKAEALAVELPSSQLAVVPNCGHLSHEETPAVLLDTLVPFCGRVLDSIRR